MHIRPAEPRDAAAINAIYNREVASSTATFDTEPYDLERRLAWLAAHQSARHPAIVAEQAGAVAGWASLSPWSERCAYARAAEVSVYVDVAARRSGVGRALLTELVARARAAGLGVLLARVVVDGPASLGLHRAVGFTSIGTMRRVGEKLGRVLDVELLELHLDEDRVV